MYAQLGREAEIARCVKVINEFAYQIISRRRRELKENKVREGLFNSTALPDARVLALAG